MFMMDGLLDAESGALVRAALEALSRRLPDDERTPAQRRADALVEMAAQRLTAGDLASSGGVRPHLLLTATPGALGGERSDSVGEIAGAGPIPTETLQRLACDSAISSVSVTGHGTPLSVGRTRRSTPPPLRRALIQRDRGCAWPGCDRPPRWTESHHIRHWARHRGHTAVANLVLLCRFHHRLAHEGGWQLSVSGGALLAQPP
jgi:hypothetical protein